MLEIVIGRDDSDKLSPKERRPFKGASLTEFPTDFTVVDLETTGLEPYSDDIIEVSALRVRDGSVVDTYSSLVKSRHPLDEFIIELTGITNEMLADAPSIREVLPRFIDFIADDIIVAHNANFDVNFLYDHYDKEFSKPFPNSFVDTYRIGRRLIHDSKHHRLTDLCEYFNITKETDHRALADSQACFELFCKLRDYAKENNIDVALARPRYVPRGGSQRAIPLEQNKEINTAHPFYMKTVVITGELKRFMRAAARTSVENVGGLTSESVTKKTDFLVLGDYSKVRSIKDGKSLKLKRAEELILQGYDLQILSEDVFIEMLESEE